MTRCGVDPVSLAAKLIAIMRHMVTPGSIVRRRVDSADRLSLQLAMLRRQNERLSATLQKTQQYTRAVIDSIETALLIIDAQGDIQCVNREFAEYFQIPHNEASGKNLTDLIENRDIDLGQIQQQFESSSGHKPLVHEFETVCRRHDRSTFTAIISLRPARLTGRHIFVVVIRDTTERDRIEADNINRTGNTFLNHLSHEMRTPLNGISGMLQLLSSSGLQPPLCSYTENALKSTRRLLHLVDSMMDLSRLEARTFKLDYIDFDLRLLVEDAASKLAPRCANIPLHCHISPRVPRWVTADPHRIVQIINHLLDNAIKFTKHGEILIKADVIRQNKTTCTVRFEVIDSGIGIDPDKSADVFEVFVQADSGISRKYEGMGLGLSLSKSLVEIMDGRIGVNSNPGRGSCFWFELPLTRSKECESVQRPLTGKHIHLAITNPTLSQTLIDYLTDAGATVNGEAAPAGTETPTGHIDLRILDRACPGPSSGDAPVLRITAENHQGDDAFYAPLRYDMLIDAVTGMMRATVDAGGPTAAKTEH